MSDSYLRKSFPAGTEIFHSGDLGNCAYIIDEGEIEIGIPLTAHQTVYNRLGPGELFGEMALIDDHRRIGTARALTDTVVRVVTSGQILDRLQHSDDVIAFILRNTLMRYRDLLHQMRRAEDPSTRAKLPNEELAKPDSREAVAKLKWKTSFVRLSTRESFGSTSSCSSPSPTHAWPDSRRSCAGRTRATD